MEDRIRGLVGQDTIVFKSGGEDVLDAVLNYPVDGFHKDVIKFNKDSFTQRYMWGIYRIAKTINPLYTLEIGVREGYSTRLFPEGRLPGGEHRPCIYWKPYVHRRT